MFYAEKIEGCEITERGVFLSIAEFAPYRKAGWSGTTETDRMTDLYLEGDENEKRMDSGNRTAPGGQ